MNATHKALLLKVTHIELLNRSFSDLEKNTAGTNWFCLQISKYNVKKVRSAEVSEIMQLLQNRDELGRSLEILLRAGEALKVAEKCQEAKEFFSLVLASLPDNLNQNIRALALMGKLECILQIVFHVSRNETLYFFDEEVEAKELRCEIKDCSTSARRETWISIESRLMSVDHRICILSGRSNSVPAKEPAPLLWLP